MHKHERAFTLVELMITLAIAAIVLGVAIPSFQRMISNNRSATLGDELVGAIRFARSEAAARNQSVSVCATANGIACGGQWQQGFMVFIDSAADTANAPVIDSADDILRVWTDISPGAEFTEANNKLFVRLLPSGELARVDNTPFDMMVHFQKCDGVGAARNVTVGLGGVVNNRRTNCP